jgi:tRNA G18 (ribose-2'-O)-methylase SpoU
MNLIRINSPDDPRVAAYREIRERDLVGRQNLFVAEGKVVLNVALSAASYGLQSVLLLENRLAGLQPMLANVPASLPVYVADAAVMDAIAGFHIHRGILAIGKRLEQPAPSELLHNLPQRALVLVLVGISNHDNIGSIFRNAAAFGADAVFLDPTCCDPLYRKSIRVSVGSVFRVPFARFAKASDFIETLAQHHIRPIALSPSGASDVRDIERNDRLALFLGTEGDGLPETLLTAMTTARISIASGFDSLNVAATSAIALHHLSYRLSSE